MLWMELEPGGGGGGEMDMLRFFIMPAQTYTIGRRGCRLSLPNGDPSISRQHAILRTTAISPSATIAAPAAPRTSSSSSSTAATTPEEVVELYLTDGSKHGSFLNGERMQRDEEVRVDDGALMRFGTRATARMSRSMMIVFAVAAELLPRELEIIVAAATRIGAHVMMQANNTVVDPRTLEEMGWRCVGLFFFCGDGFEVDGAVLDAMSYGYTLASPACAPRMAEHLASSPLVVSGAALVPSEAPRPASMALRQSTYQPPRSCTTFADVIPAGTTATTTTSSSSSSSFASNPQQLLAGYRFLLVDGSVMARYRLLIHRLGGCVLAATEVRAEMWPSMASDPQTCVLLDKDDFRRGMEVIVSRRMEVMGFSTDHPDPLISAYLQLYKHGLCLVSEENLHIVLYRADGGELCRVGGVGHLKRRRAASLTGSFRVAPAEAESFQRTSSPRQNTTTTSSSSTWKNEDDAREQAGPASSSPLRCSPSPDQPTNSTKEANAREETTLAAPVPKASNKNNKMKMDRWAVFQQSQRLCRASLERSAGGARAAASTGRDAAITAKKAGRRRLASSESVPPTTAVMDGPLSTNSSSSLHGSSDAELGSRGSTTENGRAGGGRRPGAPFASASPPTTTTTDSYAPLSFGFRRETSDPRGGPPHTAEVIPFRHTHSNNINANNNGVHTDATEVGDCDPHVKDLHELSEPLLSGDEENGGEEARSTPQTQVRRPHFVGSSSKWLRQPSMDAGVPAHESASRQSSQDRVVRTNNNNNNNNNTHKDLIASVRAAAAASSAQVAPSTVMTSSRPRLGAASVEPRHRPSNNNNNNKSTPMYEGRLSGSRAASTIASRPLAGGRRPPTVIQRSVLHSRSESVVSATGSLTFSRSSTAPRSRPQTSSAAAAGGARPPSSMAMDVYFARALTSFPNTLERT